MELPKYVINSLYAQTNEKDKTERDDFVFITYKEGLDKKTKMKIIKDTTIPFYITKPKFRNQNIKRQTCPIEELDLYFAKQKDVSSKIKEVFGIRKFIKDHELYSSPYIYNANLSSEFLTRQKIYDERVILAKAHNLPEIIPPEIITYGAIDIETSVLGNEEIILISFVTQDLKCYTAIYEPFLNRIGADEVMKSIEKNLKDKIKKYDMTFSLFIGGELECLQWCFSKIHEEKMDFLSVWNMDFDVPYILKRLKFLKQKPEDFFCDPRIPENYKYFKYTPGVQVDGKHFTDKWPFMQTTATTSFYDSMSLFSRLDRVVNGLQNSYSLGYITEKYLDETKLDMLKENTHYVMQKQRFLDYVSYNIWDAAVTVLLEKKIKNIPNMLQLNANNGFSIFHRTTSQGENRYSVFCKNIGEALCTVCGDSTTEYDDEIPALGGNVLNPNKSIDTGVPYLLDTEVLTRINVKSADSDATQMYPSIAKTINDSRDTAVHTILKVNGSSKEVEKFCSYFVDTEENAVYIGKEFLNLPDITEMLTLYDKSIR